MLELPESYTISGQIQELLTGKIISYVEVLHTPHKLAFLQGDVKSYRDLLEGQTVKGATYHGGLIEMDTEDCMIAFGDGAYPRYYEDKKKFPKKHQLAIYFDDETAVFVSIQMYGFIFVFPKGKCPEDHYISSAGKTDPLCNEFTFEYFRSLYPGNRKKLSAKAFLATEQRIPGLGNGVLQDILWNAGIDPRFDMREASETDFMALYTSVKKILKEMCEQGGRDTEKDLLGQTGKYITQLSKKTLFEPCIKCGHEIHKANFMGGTVYYCENCQKK
ncbi:zinc finger domain-containing protein [Parablautia muri]|uniref:Endonuclease VIII n=1 Tax=Parablautia muri TaxID=2320879 RepID=A0A9X5BE82_9FIRM|nr:zinc finger domain-containing protein [Parablautia muri]NBJ92371.1 endonuclease VIII [Parablautia muri]